MAAVILKIYLNDSFVFIGSFFVFSALFFWLGVLSYLIDLYHPFLLQEEARKALESALGDKKTEFEKWDKELKRREQAGGGGNSGRGGWFRWFGGSNDDHFWEEAEQTGLTILGIIAMFLIIAKGDLMIALVLNPLLFLLRGTRNGLTFLTTLVREKLNSVTNAGPSTVQQKQISAPVSARENVKKKWGSG